MPSRHLVSAVSLALVTFIAGVSSSAAAWADVLIGLATPLSGPVAWTGARTQEGADQAIAALNKKGGVLGERIRMIVVDDYCSGAQAVAAANKLVEAGVVAVVGHDCSGAAIPASVVYAKAGILMISTFATNPQLTERGLHDVFRTVGRDDVQGRIAADLLAERFGDKSIAILHDGLPYGKGLAEQVKKRLNADGMTEALFAVIEPGKPDYSDVVRKLQAMGVAVLYYAGYPPEAALIIRQAREKGYDLQLVGGDGICTEDFGLVAGQAAAEGTLVTYVPNTLAAHAVNSATSEADLIRALAGRKATEVQSIISAYAAVQAWAQAVEKAGTVQSDAVAKALRSYKFDTVLGRIGFDEKGDVTGYNTFDWFVWSRGDIVPLNAAALQKN
jgi:branched-chain amino acid transport system substrate-binding protein